MREYDQVLPGLAERIARMAEKEQEHRHKAEGTIVSEHFAAVRRGQHYAFVIAIASLVAGVGLALGVGWEVSLAPFVLTGGSVAVAFLRGRDAPAGSPGSVDGDE